MGNAIWPSRTVNVRYAFAEEHLPGEMVEAIRSVVKEVTGLEHRTPAYLVNDHDTVVTIQSLGVDGIGTGQILLIASLVTVPSNGNCWQISLSTQPYPLQVHRDQIKERAPLRRSPDETALLLHRLTAAIKPIVEPTSSAV